MHTRPGHATNHDRSRNLDVPRDDCRALIGNPGCGDLFQRCTEIVETVEPLGQRLAFASTSCLNLGNGTCR